MATYAVGDIQGCYTALMQLLEKIAFDPKQDVLWCAGDLVNRGPQSREVLQFFVGLGKAQRVVLGNHDLHLLAVACGGRKYHAGDTFNDILTSPDRDELLHWLRAQPLLIHDEKLNYVMAHAGLAPSWDLATAKRLAQEVETVLRSEQHVELFHHMYGAMPDRWDEQLTGMDRLRCIVNHFTRMRYCYADGRLDLSYKGGLDAMPAELIPWYKVTPRANADERIIFGHWAALNGVTGVKNIFALDTGCIWGGCLTAMRLEDGMHFQVSCS